MKYATVSSGIEAPSVAWHPLGWQPVFFSEIDRFPSRVLAHHYPDVPNLGDMTRFNEWSDYAIDVFCAGTPCQSFSVAGLRKGLADPRGNLMLTYLAIAARYRPKWLVWENVRGVLSSNGGRDFGTFLGGLAECGYGFAYRVLDAQYFGVAQRRRRVFIVGHLGDWRPAAAVLFERDSLCGNPAPRRKTGQGVAAGFECGPSGGGFTDIAATLDTRCKDGPIRNQLGNGVIQHSSTGEVAHCLNAGGMGRQDYETETMVCHPINTQIAMRHNAMGEGTGFGIGDSSDPSFTLQANHSHAVAYSLDSLSSNSMKSDNPHSGCHVSAVAKTIDTTRPDPSKNQGGHAIVSNAAVRRLTPRECERLQGFPDDYTLIPKAADGPRYKALGNSMAVPVMRWVGQRIQEVMTYVPR